jgi:hypothetical protein
MALPFHNVVSLSGWIGNDTIHTVNLGLAADGSAIIKADEGRAMTIDTSGPNKFKLAGEGDAVIGILVTFEDRISGPVGAVGFEYIMPFKLKAADLAAVGDTVVGAAGTDGRGGWVKKSGSNTPYTNFIAEKATDASTVVVVRL